MQIVCSNFFLLCTDNRLHLVKHSNSLTNSLSLSLILPPPPPSTPPLPEIIFHNLQKTSIGRSFSVAALFYGDIAL